MRNVTLGLCLECACTAVKANDLLHHHHRDDHGDAKNHWGLGVAPGSGVSKHGGRGHGGSSSRGGRGHGDEGSHGGHHGSSRGGGHGGEAPFGGHEAGAFHGGHHGGHHGGSWGDGHVDDAADDGALPSGVPFALAVGREYLVKPGARDTSVLVGVAQPYLLLRNKRAAAVVAEIEREGARGRDVHGYVVYQPSSGAYGTLEKNERCTVQMAEVAQESLFIYQREEVQAAMQAYQERYDIQRDGSVGPEVSSRRREQHELALRRFATTTGGDMPTPFAGIAWPYFEKKERAGAYSELARGWIVASVAGKRVDGKQWRWTHHYIAILAEDGTLVYLNLGQAGYSLPIARMHYGRFVEAGKESALRILGDKSGLQPLPPMAQRARLVAAPAPDSAKEGRSRHRHARSYEHVSEEAYGEKLAADDFMESRDRAEKRRDKDVTERLKQTYNFLGPDED